jgi:hypothetical protein
MEKTGGRRSNMAAGAWAVIVILAAPLMLLAQATGTMSGYVKDSSGGVVPQAKVTATLVQRGTTFIVETNAEGFYNPTVGRRCRCRTCPYLNNIVEQDHRGVKRRIHAKQGIRSLQAHAEPSQATKYST